MPAWLSWFAPTVEHCDAAEARRPPWHAGQALAFGWEWQAHPQGLKSLKVFCLPDVTFLRSLWNNTTSNIVIKNIPCTTSTLCIRKCETCLVEVYANHPKGSGSKQNPDMFISSMTPWWISFDSKRWLLDTRCFSLLLEHSHSDNFLILWKNNLLCLFDVLKYKLDICLLGQVVCLSLMYGFMHPVNLPRCVPCQHSIQLIIFDSRICNVYLSREPLHAMYLIAHGFLSVSRLSL